MKFIEFAGELHNFASVSFVEIVRNEEVRYEQSIVRLHKMYGQIDVYVDEHYKSLRDAQNRIAHLRNLLGVE